MTHQLNISFEKRRLVQPLVTNSFIVQSWFPSVVPLTGHGRIALTGSVFQMVLILYIRAVPKCGEIVFCFRMIWDIENWKNKSRYWILVLFMIDIYDILIYDSVIFSISVIVLHWQIFLLKLWSATNSHFNSTVLNSFSNI